MHGWLDQSAQRLLVLVLVHVHVHVCCKAIHTQKPCSGSVLCVVQVNAVADSPRYECRAPSPAIVFK